MFHNKYVYKIFVLFKFWKIYVYQGGEIEFIIRND